MLLRHLNCCVYFVQKNKLNALSGDLLAMQLSHSFVQLSDVCQFNNSVKKLRYNNVFIAKGKTYCPLWSQIHQSKLPKQHCFSSLTGLADVTGLPPSLLYFHISPRTGSKCFGFSFSACAVVVIVIRALNPADNLFGLSFTCKQSCEVFVKRLLKWYCGRMLPRAAEQAVFT